MHKFGQSEQSSATKAEKLENDFTEVAAKVQELGWKEGKRLSRCWVEKKRTKARDKRLPFCFRSSSLRSEVGPILDLCE